MSTSYLTRIFDYSYWEKELADLNRKYSSADPYPHIVLENFLSTEAAETALKEFPSLDSSEWINYVHYNENKFGKNKIETFPLGIKAIVEELNSEKFLNFLSRLTGIKDLNADWGLEGGGLHQTKRGGFLNIHADFTAHPHNLKWKRRVNVLVYLNKNWQESYGGSLELWDKKMKSCVKKVAPVFNRAVIFNTDEDSHHGYPHPITCPEDITRKSIALYYFTEEAVHKVHSTNYKPIPTDNLFKRCMIILDKMVLSSYDMFKRIFKFDDRFVSNVLKTISSLKKK